MSSATGSIITLPDATTIDVTNMTFNKTVQRQVVTNGSHTDGWDRREATTKSASGSFSIVWNPAKLVDTDQSMDVGDEALVDFGLVSSGKTYECNILITDVNTTCNPQGDVIRQDCNWESNGVVTNPVTSSPAPMGELSDEDLAGPAFIQQEKKITDRERRHQARERLKSRQQRDREPQPTA